MHTFIYTNNMSFHIFILVFLFLGLSKNGTVKNTYFASLYNLPRIQASIKTLANFCAPPPPSSTPPAHPNATPNYQAAFFIVI